MKRFDANKYKYSGMSSNIVFISNSMRSPVKYSQFKCNGLEQQVLNCYHKISDNANECKKNKKYYYATTSCESTNGKCFVSSDRCNVHFH